MKQSLKQTLPKRRDLQESPDRAQRRQKVGKRDGGNPNMAVLAS